MRILIMGAGAVGAYFGARLQAAGEDVVFCARGANLAAMREKGLKITSYLGDLHLRVKATDDPSQFGPYDLVLFCVKAYDTDAAAAQLRGCLAPGGVVLTLQNGIESEERLSRLFGRESVMGGNARVGVELVAPGEVVHSTTGTIDFGELNQGETPRARTIAEIFKRAGILGELTGSLRTARWDKLMWNASFNTVSALTRRRVGDVLADPDGHKLVRTLMEEVRKVACADGCEIPPQRVDQFIRHSEHALKTLKTSTLQDLERGKRLEYDALSGAVVRAARRLNVAVPAMETVNTLLKLMEAGRAAGAAS